MKTLILLITFIISLNSYAKLNPEDKAYLESLEHAKREDFFTALDTIAKFYISKTPEQNIKQYIEDLTAQTGTHYFNTYKDIQLRMINTPTTQLIMAKRNMYLGKWHYAIKRLKKYPKTHRLYPEAMMVLGSVYALSGQDDKAHETYQKCSSEAKAQEDKSEYKTKRYFAVIKESCFIDRARIHFRNRDYQKALDLYNEVPKTSFKWPYILIEKAWSHYYLGNYNRSLGVLITYNSPLLQSYFMPEAEILKALNYFKMCLFEDALKVIESYYSIYKPKSDKLRSVITSGEKQPLFYFELMFSDLSEADEKSIFLRNIVTQVSTRVKYNLDIASLQVIEKEIIKGNPTVDMQKLLDMQKDLKEQINHYVKVSMYRFINEIHQLSTEMFNLKLEILSRQRDLVYRNAEISTDRKRGDFKNVKRASNEEFWTFHNAFWADELGDYSFGLKSACTRGEG